MRREVVIFNPSFIHFKVIILRRRFFDTMLVILSFIDFKVSILLRPSWFFDTMLVILIFIDLMV